MSVAQLARLTLTAESFPVTVDGAGAVPIAGSMVAQSPHHFS